VVIIPKPVKADYSVPKAYRPILLMECLGKTLEKVVAARLNSDIDHFGLIPPSQFGSRHFHSAPDAATMLRYKAETTIKAGRIGVVILMDISHFFDSLDPSLMEQILLHLGVNPHTSAWVKSLMVDRIVTLHINGFVSEGFQPRWGTPQGSPVFPILSALFTAPLLHMTREWVDADFSLYVDDGNVFTSGPTFDSAAICAATAANKVLVWLRSFGLSVDAEKTEAMFFHPPNPSPSRFGCPPHGLTLSDGGEGRIHVTPCRSLRYLGVFFTPRLSWALHVKTLATRARSTIWALGVVGNSVRGFSLPRWRRIFQAVIVPVLTYGCQVWFTDCQQKSLIAILQVAQNEACRKIGGFFRTTPAKFMHNLSSIPPIRYRLRHLLRQASMRLDRLPPSVSIRNPARTRGMTEIPDHVECRAILPPSTYPTQPFYLPPHPSTPAWSHPRFITHSKPEDKTGFGPSKRALREQNPSIWKVWLMVTEAQASG
jgi:hypothetical protein